MDTCRLIHDKLAGSGAWNMAVDEALLLSAVKWDACTVRVYAWNAPTVSLGYFQRVDAPPDDSRISHLPAVRRLSGGGAILHHHEITYACAVPACHSAAQSPTGIYRLVHAAIIRVLDRYGVAAHLRGIPGAEGDAAFLCFSRGDPHDILCRGQKILGSAQRRRRGAVLQHGSLLLRRSEFAPEHAGMLDLIEQPAEAQELPEELGRAIAGEFADRVESGALTEEEVRMAGRLESSRYTRRDWRGR